MNIIAEQSKNDDYTLIEAKLPLMYGSIGVATVLEYMYEMLLMHIFGNKSWVYTMWVLQEYVLTDIIPNIVRYMFDGASRIASYSNTRGAIEQLASVKYGMHMYCKNNYNNYVQQIIPTTDIHWFWDEAILANDHIFDNCIVCMFSNHFYVDATIPPSLHLYYSFIADTQPPYILLASKLDPLPTTVIYHHQIISHKYTTYSLYKYVYVNNYLLAICVKQ
jgi:hypothetical protein